MGSMVNSIISGPTPGLSGLKGKPAYRITVTCPTSSDAIFFDDCTNPLFDSCLPRCGPSAVALPRSFPEPVERRRFFPLDGDDGWWGEGSALEKPLNSSFVRPGRWSTLEASREFHKLAMPKVVPRNLDSGGLGWVQEVVF